MNFMSGACLTSTDFTYVPWGSLARHGSALLAYGLAVHQWPSNSVSELWSGEDQTYGHNLLSWLFTLLLWSAMLFHYTISAGRISVNTSSRSVRAQGWVVRHSRRAHRVLLCMTMAVSLLTLMHAATVELIINHHRYLVPKQPPSRRFLLVLKVDQVLSGLLFIYIFARVIFEPVGLKKTKVQKSEQEPDKGAEEAGARGLSSPVCPEECAICLSKWANRRLSCGHLLCCCCLLEIFRIDLDATRCPFCRAEITGVCRLTMHVGEDVGFVDCCSAPTLEELERSMLGTDLRSRDEV